MTSLDEIRQKVVKCTKCELCETRTNAVPGKGSLQADVIFVGEAPGRSEDRAGEPFVGVAGQKLADALQAARVSREEVYITNVVKCRPPNNRVPKTGERDACHEYLMQEIFVIRPKIICILGNTAFNSVLGGSEITKFRGKLVRKNGQLYFLTVHPAAIIYNQKLVSVLKNDIVRLFDLIKELKDGKKVVVDIEYDDNNGAAS